MKIGGTSNHREREKGALVYPVYSRRSGGLSVGINLFSDRKLCSFDCPYCEVFPFSAAQTFSLPLMEQALAQTLSRVQERGIAVKDICFSGNGEPTLSADFPAALEVAITIRDKQAQEAAVVLITNGSGLLDEGTFDLLRRSACAEHGLRVWLKLDAGTPSWYNAMSRSSIPFERLIEKIRAFVKLAPVMLQTMLCAVNGSPPPEDEGRAWEALVTELACNAVDLREVQIYGKARPAPEDPVAGELPEDFLYARAASLKSALAAIGKEITVNIYP